MALFSQKEVIKCCFSSNFKPFNKDQTEIVEVFFAETKDLIQIIGSINGFLEDFELNKASNFLNKNDSYTYRICHAVLRMAIAKRLDLEPNKVRIKYDRNMKPHIDGSKIYFNISHTREAFAIAVAGCHVGIDIEMVRRINFESIIKRFYSRGENEYIMESPSDSLDRFFILWTRKESLLKALGVGIIAELSEIEVYNPLNIIKKSALIDYKISNLLYDHFISSYKILNYYLSVTLPQKTDIRFLHLNMDNIKYLL